MSENDRVYWAKKPADDMPGVIRDRMRRFREWLSMTGRLDVWDRAMRCYYGQDQAHGYSNSVFVTYDGDQGELVKLRVNHFRSLVRSIHVMCTASRPAFSARAVNTDSDSISQALLADGIIDFYLDERQMEDELVRCAELALLQGISWFDLRWDTEAGEVIEADVDTQRLIRQGDVTWSMRSGFDVAFDVHRSDAQHSWVIVCRRVNRYDLAAQYPEKEQEILSQAPDTDASGEVFGTRRALSRGMTGAGPDNDLVCVYDLIHAQTPSMPQGRLCTVVGDVWLFDGPMPFEEIPVIPMIPSIEQETPAGYADSWDIMAVQQVMDSIVSTMCTNHDATGVQNVWTMPGQNLDVVELGGGLRHVKSVQKPEPIVLTQISEHSYKLLELLGLAAETISGVNAVARGNPQDSLKSGAALALVQSMAIQFNSGVQRSYARLLERVATTVIKLLQRFAKAPRIIQIVGRSQMSAVQQFSRDGIQKVRRVSVNMSNPLMRTVAGRREAADTLLDHGLIKTPEQYYAAIDTGRVDLIYEGDRSEIILIRAEGERMTKGEQVPALPTDNHRLHVQEHKVVLANPDVRRNPEVLEVVLGHIMEHKMMLEQTDPGLLELTGQQPLMSSMMMGPAPPDGAGEPGDESAPEDGPPPSPRAQPPGTEANESMPRMPRNPLNGEPSAAPQEIAG